LVRGLEIVVHEGRNAEVPLAIVVVTVICAMDELERS